MIFKEKADSLNELINDKADCRTASATPGLLNIKHSKNVLGLVILKSNPGGSLVSQNTHLKCI